jgi:CheY-like chemotaxis protein
VLVSFYLEHAGLDVTLVENGKLACDAALKAVSDGTPFDLILMDMQMPEMDGYAATTLLRELKYRGPIVALTAHALGGDREKCIACGCDDFAVKPIDPARFMSTIRKYVKVAGATGQAAGSAPLSPSLSPEPPKSVHIDDPMAALLAKPKLAKLVERFVTGLDDRLAAIQHAVEDDDRKQLRMLAHQLKGAAGGFGFPNISRAASEVEFSTEHELEDLNAAINELTAMCHQAKQSRTNQPARS